MFIAAMISSIFALGPVPVWWGLVIVSAITILLVIPFKKGLLGTLLPYLATPVVIGPLFIVMGISLTKAASIDLIFPHGPEGIFINAGNVILAAIAIAAFMGRPVGLTWNFIPVVLILFIAEISNITDTIGCYQATAKLVGQKLIKERTNRGIFVETAVFFSVIPWAIYGGAMVIILGTIIFVGIQMMFAMEMTETKKLIAGFAMIVGICFVFIPQPVIDADIPFGPRA